MLLAKRREIDLLWRSANIEVAVTLPQTRDIFNGIAPYGAEAHKVRVVNNLKHCWRFLFENSAWPVDWGYLSEYNRLAEDGLETAQPGAMRDIPVAIAGTDYVPDIPDMGRVRQTIDADLHLADPEERAIALFCDVCRGQWFENGNKRTAVMAANHTLIHDGAGIFSLPPEHMDDQFLDRLIDYYGSGDRAGISRWLETNAIGRLPDGLTDAEHADGTARP